MFRNSIRGVGGSCIRQASLQPRRKMASQVATTQTGNTLSTRNLVLIGTTAAAGGIIVYSLYRNRVNLVQKHHSAIASISCLNRQSPFRTFHTYALAALGQSSSIRNDSPKGFASKRNVQTSSDEARAKDESEGEKSPLTDWSNMGDKLANVVVPAWAKNLPRFVDKLQEELKMEDGTLAHEIWKDAHDPSVHPEIIREATVRVSTELCDEEQAFLKERKRHTTKALAKYLDIPADDINPEDVPTIAMCGSGGGLRALVAGASSYLSTQEAGLFDCVTYTAGVSGSTWLQALYYSSISGQRHNGIINHLKNRIHVHIAFPPPLMKLLASSPTHKYLLSGVLEKYKGQKKVDFGLVDVYGLLLGARLLVPKGDLEVNDMDLKISNQRRFVDSGEHPLPIYCAVRHEIPNEDNLKDADDATKEQAKKESWFQWYESTPYEFFCEEVGAGIPIWALGRHFKGGKDVARDEGTSLPEVRMPILMGIWGSAFCATLSHYYKEIRPVIKGLTGFGGLDKMIEDRNDDLVNIHPVDPASLPNFAYDMKDQLPESTPNNLITKEDIKLMDAGMSNNLPIYPLLRPGRDVDVLIAFDASADIKEENWLRVADGYAKQRGIRGWPIGTGWPENKASGAQQTGEALDDAENKTTEEANQNVNEAEQDQKSTKQKGAEPSGQGGSGELDYCNIWVGTTQQRESEDEPPQSTRVEEDWQLMTPDAGIAVIYFPFMSNPKVDGVDPQTTDFMSTWNFIYQPEDVDKVVELAKANFNEGADKVKMTVRAVYERKKKQRLEREKKESEERRKNWWKAALG